GRLPIVERARRHQVLELGLRKERCRLVPRLAGHGEDGRCFDDTQLIHLLIIPEHAVHLGCRPGQHGGVRRKSDARQDCACLQREGTLFHQPLECLCSRLLDGIGAQTVDGDDHHVLTQCPICRLRDRGGYRQRRQPGCTTTGHYERRCGGTHCQRNGCDKDQCSARYAANGRRWLHGDSYCGRHTARATQDCPRTRPGVDV